MKSFTINTITNSKLILEIDGKVINSKELAVFIDGFVLPRDSIYNEYSKYSQNNLILELYKKYKEKFIEYIKGNFIIIIKEPVDFHLFTDHFGIKKFFYFHDNNKIIISNQLKNITNNIDTTISNENIAIHALLCHHICGTTIFKNIFSSTSASYFHIFENNFNINNYWSINELYNLSRENINYADISKQIVTTIQRYLDYLKINKISLSLTGGNDTRIILAALLKIGVNPHLYTYGNPNSYDSLVPQKIASTFNLEHETYDIKFDKSSFKQKANDIVIRGNSITSIHRAHRMESIKKESKFAKSMFLGTLGGEFIKGATINDYIISNFVSMWWNNNVDKKKLILSTLNKKFINTNNISIDYIEDFLAKQPFFCNGKDQNELFALSDITAQYHDAQDINLYNSYLDNVIPVFLDIDYLYLLFASNYTFLSKNEIQNKLLRKLENPFFASNLVKNIYPDLLDIEYSSHYSPKELLNNKYLTAIKKKVRGQFNKFPPNFPLDSWMEEFVKYNIFKAKKDLNLRKIYNWEDINKAILNEEYESHEAAWLRYTNVIMNYYFVKEYIG